VTSDFKRPKPNPNLEELVEKGTKPTGGGR
jgi:hypothetical protein